MLYMMIAWLIPIAWVSVSFSDFTQFLKETPFETIIAVAIVLGGAYSSLIIGFMFKCDEYENWIENHCQK
jgi:hypothetical protein